jgi:hypothetical protein
MWDISLPAVNWSVAVLGVAADAASKGSALSRLSGGRDITMAGGLIRLQLVINHGASFGLGAGYEPLLAAAAFAGMILLGAWAVRAASRAERLGAALAMAGAAGKQPHRPLDPAARRAARRRRGLDACLVLRPDLQPGGYLAAGRPADRRGRVAMATPDTRFFTYTSTTAPGEVIGSGPSGTAQA